MSKKPLLAALLGLTFVGMNGVILAAEEKAPAQPPAAAPAQPPAATPAQPPAAKPAQPPAAAEKKPLPDPVAVVNGVPISLALYNLYAQQRQSRMGDSDTPAARKAIIDNLVLQELLMQQAQQQHLTDDPQVVSQIELMKRSVLANAVLRKVLSDKASSEEEIKKEYDNMVASMSKKEYKARHILVDAEDKAKNLIEQIKKENGANFSELAKANSSDSSAAEGGDLGWFTADVMVPPFSEAVGKLEKGKFTEQPVKTDFGWHIIILDDIRDTSPPPLADVRPQIMQSLQGRTVNEYLEKLRKDAKVEVK